MDENTIKLASNLGNAINGTALDLTTATNTTITGIGLTLSRSDEDSKVDFVERINRGLQSQLLIQLLQVTPRQEVLMLQLSMRHQQMTLCLNSR